MAKLTLEDLDNLRNENSAVGTINANNAAIEAALEKTLSRDGTSPNTMTANLDMNSNRIVNVADPVNGGDIVNLNYITNSLDNAVADAVVLAEGYRDDAAASATEASGYLASVEADAAAAATSATQAAASATSAAAAAADAFEGSGSIPRTGKSSIELLDGTTTLAAIRTDAGREGLYVSSSGDYSDEVTADTDGANYIADGVAATSARAFVRAEVLRHREYRVSLGDLDPAGTTNEVMINKIIDSIEQPGTLFLPPDNYGISGQILINKEINTRGYGNRVTVFEARSGGSFLPLLIGPGANGTLHQDWAIGGAVTTGSVDGDDSAIVLRDPIGETSYTGTDTAPVQNVTLLRMRGFGGGTGVRVGFGLRNTADPIVGAEDCAVIDFEADDVAHFGVEVSGAHRTKVVSPVIRLNPSALYNKALRIIGAEDTVVENPWIIGDNTSNSKIAITVEALLAGSTMTFFKAVKNTTILNPHIEGGFITNLDVTYSRGFLHFINPVIKGVNDTTTRTVLQINTRGYQKMPQVQQDTAPNTGAGESGFKRGVEHLLLTGLHATHISKLATIIGFTEHLQLLGNYLYSNDVSTFPISFDTSATTVDYVPRAEIFRNTMITKNNNSGFLRLAFGNSTSVIHTGGNFATTNAINASPYSISGSGGASDTKIITYPKMPDVMMDYAMWAAREARSTIYDPIV